MGGLATNMDLISKKYLQIHNSPGLNYGIQELCPGEQHRYNKYVTNTSFYYDKYRSLCNRDKHKICHILQIGMKII